MHTTGFILGVRAAQRETNSARPDAPLVPDKQRRSSRPPRPARTTSARRAAAASLRSIAAWIEPRRDTEPCRPATS
jgi:hypothetical protein